MTSEMRKQVKATSLSEIFIFVKRWWALSTGFFCAVFQANISKVDLESLYKLPGDPTQYLFKITNCLWAKY